MNLQNYIIIRNERPDEQRRVEELIRDAFWNVNEPGANEHYLAHIMRSHPDFVPELNLVAELDGKIVGSIMYTRCKLVGAQGERRETLTFGPIAVHPDYQRRGIGKAMIEESFCRAREMGYDSVVIFGHPGNYVARGFVSCLKVNVCVGDGYFPTAMLVKSLTEDAFDGRPWRYEGSEAAHFDPRMRRNMKKLSHRRKRKCFPARRNSSFIPIPPFICKN